MKRSLLVIKAEIVKQQQHDYHSWFVYLSLLVWPILGFLRFIIHTNHLNLQNIWELPIIKNCWHF